MVTEEEYKNAVAQQQELQKIINQYHKEEAEAFHRRLKERPIFTDEELVYSASQLCPCGHGLAYPKGCGACHYWDCSAILKGTADKNAEHTGQLPFAFYELKSESDRNGTTRGVFKPRQQ
jgi:hypothetical protein